MRNDFTPQASVTSGFVGRTQNPRPAPLMPLAAALPAAVRPDKALMQQLPPTTRALMLICTAVFCVQKLAPYEFSSWLMLHGPMSGSFMPWQVVSYAFLHNNFLHLFFNMLGLWMFGAELEMLWGRKRYLQFLLACVLTAAAAQLSIGAFFSGGAMLGASGAVFGVLLATAMQFPHRDVTLVIPPVTLNIRILVTIYAVLELLYGVQGSSGVAHFAHLGGMVGSFLMIQYWRGRPPFRNKRRY
jgi:membrane associated rhomboid family serine protease